VLFGPSDGQLSLLAILQIWRDTFLGLSLAYAGGWGEVVSLERGCWSRGGGSAILPRLRRWEMMGLGPRNHADVPRSTCHSDMCFVACSRPIHRLTKPHWRWCFLGSCNGGASTFLSVCALVALELGDGCWLWWLQETLGIDSYFFISYDFIYSLQSEITVGGCFKKI
jgi:hypothetical protein